MALKQRQLFGRQVLIVCPIVAMTAHAMKGYRQKCIDAGMDDYVTKPIKKDEVIGVIEKQMRRIKS